MAPLAQASRHPAHRQGAYPACHAQHRLGLARCLPLDACPGSRHRPIRLLSLRTSSLLRRPLDACHPHGPHLLPVVVDAAVVAVDFLAGVSHQAGEVFCRPSRQFRHLEVEEVEVFCRPRRHPDASHSPLRHLQGLHHSRDLHQRPARWVGSFLDGLHLDGLHLRPSFEAHSASCD